MKKWIIILAVVLVGAVLAMRYYSSQKSQEHAGEAVTQEQPAESTPEGVATEEEGTEEAPAEEGQPTTE